MPTSIKQLMTVNPPTSPTEWLRVATRLMKTQAPKPEQNTFRQNVPIRPRQNTFVPQNRYSVRPNFQNFNRMRPQHLPNQHAHNFNNRAAYAAGARKIAIIPSTRDEYSHFQGELESIYNKLIAFRDSLDVPLFSIPPNQAALYKIVARVTSKRKKAAAPTENNTSDNTSNAPKSLVKRETRKRATVDEDGFRLPSKKQTANPNGKPFLSSPAAILTHPNSSAPSAPPIILSNAYEEVEEIELDTESKRLRLSLLG
ncbi:uncharacterized protein TNCV_5013501 [Trichonephila clavipes]|nr:uncharacterized protein TNCV_5013501 [Trichonephila clavipes]